VLGAVIGAAVIGMNQQNGDVPAGQWGDHRNEPVPPPNVPYNQLADNLATNPAGDVGSDATPSGRATQQAAQDKVWKDLDETLDAVGEHNRLTSDAVRGERDNSDKTSGRSDDMAPISNDQQIAWGFQLMEATLKKVKKENADYARLLQLYLQETQKGRNANPNTIAALKETIIKVDQQRKTDLATLQGASNRVFTLRSKENDKGWRNGTYNQKDKQALDKVNNLIKELKQPIQSK
jgi:hypothetical protein